MYKDIINDLIYVKTVSQDDRTDLQFNEDIQKLKKEYPIATPIYEIEFKKPLTPIRKYYSELIKNFITKKLNQIITNSKTDKLEEEYQYLYKSTESEIKQYFHFIREHISSNQLSEDLYKNPSRDKKSDEAYVIHFMKYNCIMLYKELQDRFKGKAEFEEMELEELQETYLYEETPKVLIIKPYDGAKIQYVEKANENVFKSIKGDLTHRELNEKIIEFDSLIKKQEAFILLEQKLHDYEIIDANYNFIPNKENSNKQTLAAFILKLYQKEYFNIRRFNPNKTIKDRDITKFFAHRYGNNSDTNKEFRNFKTSDKLKYNQIISQIAWLDKIQ